MSVEQVIKPSAQAAGAPEQTQHPRVDDITMADVLVKAADAKAKLLEVFRFQTERTLQGLGSVDGAMAGEAAVQVALA